MHHFLIDHSVPLQWNAHDLDDLDLECITLILMILDLISRKKKIWLIHGATSAQPTTNMFIAFHTFHKLKIDRKECTIAAPTSLLIYEHPQCKPLLKAVIR